MEEAASLDNLGGLLYDASTTVDVTTASTVGVPRTDGTIAADAAVPYSASAVARLVAIVVVAVHVAVSFVADSHSA